LGIFAVAQVVSLVVKKSVVRGFDERRMLNSTHSKKSRSLGMGRRNGSFVLRSLCVFLVGWCSVRVLGQSAGSAATQQPAAAANQSTSSSSPSLANSNVKLGIGDLVDISVFGVPDLSTKTRVSGSGDIYLPLIDYVHVAGLTTDEAQVLIEKRLEDGGFVRSPHVSIFVNESASQSITVIGEVTRPGAYPAIGERRLFDLISAAGGLTDKAGRNVTIEHRGDPGQQEELQLSPNLTEETKSNVDVYPGDTIIVSRAGIVYVVGDVQRPSGFRIEDASLSVLKALALAGGNTHTSALGKSRILRQTPSGVQEIPVDLKKMLYAKTPDMAMVKGDILFVPGSAAKTALYKSADVILALSTSLAVLAVQ
jgi:polysaccharide biosynthesis/export protein